MKKVGFPAAPNVLSVRLQNFVMERRKIPRNFHSDLCGLGAENYREARALGAQGHQHCLVAELKSVESPSQRMQPGMMKARELNVHQLRLPYC